MKILGIAAFVMAASFAVTAHAEAKMDWKACDKEIKEFKCKGTDKDVWACLETHDGKLSKPCEELHSKADEKFGAKK